MLISAGAFDPTISISRSHVPSLSHLSTVSPMAALMVPAAIYRAPHVEINSDRGTCSIWDALGTC